MRGDADESRAGTQTDTTTYHYDAVGNLDLVLHANGSFADYDYDAMDRLDLLSIYEADANGSATAAARADNPLLAEYDYTSRADGKRTGVTETTVDTSLPVPVNRTATFTWTYDAAGRLISETLDHHDNALDQAQAWTYDLAGNRRSQTVDRVPQGPGLIDATTTYTYDANDRLVTEATDLLNGTDTTAVYSYDATVQTNKKTYETAAGPMAMLANAAYGYSRQGRLAETVVDRYDGSGTLLQRDTTRYAYDSNGIRVSATHEVVSDHDGLPTTPIRVSSHAHTAYLNDPQNHTGYAQVLEETTTDLMNSNALAERRTYTIGHDVAAQSTATDYNDAGATYRLMYDGHGSTRFLTDAAGAVPESYTYDAYGVALGFDAGAALTEICQFPVDRHDQAASCSSPLT